MAKSVGVDAGEFEVKVVEMDGSYRKPRLTKVVVEPVAESGSRAIDETHALNSAEAVRHALRSGGMSKDHLIQAFPSREAVIRLLNVPFVGEDKIRKVIKFEAEGSIHSHNVDDMVVDFHVVSAAKNETKVLVAAVPKAPLRSTLAALERLGLEPNRVDLDAMALFRAAEWCGAFAPAEGAEDAGDLPMVAPPCRVVLDCGARSTRVLVVVDGVLVDMRALRTGADSIAEDVAAGADVDFNLARAGVRESLVTGGDYVTEPRDDLDDESEGAGDAESEAGAMTAVAVGPIAHRDIVAARDRYLDKLRRELRRFLTSLPALSNVEAVWITGGASTIDGVEGLVEDVFGRAPQRLDVMANLSHRLDDEAAAELGPKLAVAVGLAVQALGGAPGFNFRQEDLSFTKGFDRIKFPLAIACMLALFLVLVVALRARRELTGLEREYGSVYKTEMVGRKKNVEQVTFFGYVGSLINPNGSWFAAGKAFEAKEYPKLVEKVTNEPVFGRLKVIRRELQRYFRNLEQESGVYSELRLGSGLGVLVELTQVLSGIEDQLGRYLIKELEVRLPPRTEGRYLAFQIILREDDKGGFRQKGEVLLSALREAAKAPSSSFLEIDERKTGEKDPFTSESGAGSGYYLNVRVNLKSEDDFPIFPNSQL